MKRPFSQVAALFIVLVLSLTNSLNSTSAQTTYDVITVANAKNVSAIATLKTDAGKANSIDFSQDGILLASGYADSSIHLWDIATQKETDTLKDEKDDGEIVQVRFGAGARLLALVDLAGISKVMRLWDIKTGTSTIFGLATESAMALQTTAAISRDGKVIARDFCGGDVGMGTDGTLSCLSTGVRFLNADTEKELAVFNPVIKGSIVTLTFSPDGTFIAVVASDGTVRLVDTKTGKVKRTLGKISSQPTSATFSADGTLLAVSAADGTVRLWNTGTGTAMATLQGGKSEILSVAFNTDATLLALAGKDMTLQLWDMKTKKMLVALEGHTDSVTSVVFSPDGTLLASSSMDGTVRLWAVKK